MGKRLVTTATEVAKEKKAKGAAILSSNRGPAVKVPTSDMIGNVRLMRGASKTELVDEVTITAQKFCSKGNIYQSQFGATDLYAVYLSHQAKPGVFYKAMTSFRLYAAAKHVEDNQFPETFRLFEKYYAMKLVQTPGNEKDVDGIGFKEWSLAIYVDGKSNLVKNVLMMLDDYVAWRSGRSDGGVFYCFTALTDIPKIIFRFPRELGITIDETDNMSCAFEVCNDMSKTQFSAFDVVPPTYPARIVVAQIVDTITLTCLA